MRTGDAPSRGRSERGPTPLGGRETRLGATVARALAFERLQWVSFAHSVVYLCLLVCAFALGNPQPATFILGLAHGVLWIAMSLACIAAARLRIVPLRLAVAVAVLGGIGPFFGSYEFVRQRRRREARTDESATPPAPAPASG